MKFAVKYLIILSMLFYSCEKPDTEQVVTEEEEEKEVIFDVIFATSYANPPSTKNIQHYGEWVISCNSKLLASESSKIHAFNKDSGEEAWQLSYDQLTGGKINNTLLQDNILVAMNNHYLFAIDLDTKELIWQTNFNELGMRLRLINITNNGNLYLTTQSNSQATAEVAYLFEIDILDGSYGSVYEKPNTSATQYFTSPPEIWYDESMGKDILVLNLYSSPSSSTHASELSQHLIGVDLDTKEELWQIPVVDQWGSSAFFAPVIEGNNAIVGGWNEVFCFDLTLKEKKWSSVFDSEFGVWHNTRFLTNNNKIYSMTDGELVCLDLENGSIIWRKDRSASVLCTDVILYYEKEDVLLYACGKVTIFNNVNGETIDELLYLGSYNYDIVYDEERDMFFTSTAEHVVGFKVNIP